MKSSHTLKTKDCRAEGYADDDGSVPASINDNLEIPIGSVDCVTLLSSTEGSIKSGLSIQLSCNEGNTVIQQGAGGNSLGEKIKSSFFDGSISRHKSSSLLPFSFITPSSRQGRNEEQQVQQQQQQPVIMYLRDLMFNSNLLGPISNFDKDSKPYMNEDEGSNNLMVEDIMSQRKETDLFYDAEEGTMGMLASKDASNTNGNQDQEGRKRIVRFAVDQGSSLELIEDDQRLLAQTLQDSLCALDIYNESDGGPYDIETYSDNHSTNINNFYRKMIDDEDEASSCNYYSDEDEDSDNPKNKIIRGMFYSLGGMAVAGATVGVSKLFSSVRESKDSSNGSEEVVSQGTQNTVDTVHLFESSTNIVQSSSSALKTSSSMLQSSALNSGTSSGASYTSVSSSMATSSVSSSVASSAGASASSTTASTVLTSAASASSVASTASSSAVSNVASSTISAASSASLASGTSAAVSTTSAVSASASAAVATQTVAVAAQ